MAIPFKDGVCNVGLSGCRYCLYQPCYRCDYSTRCQYDDYVWLWGNLNRDMSNYSSFSSQQRLLLYSQNTYWMWLTLDTRKHGRIVQYTCSTSNLQQVSRLLIILTGRLLQINHLPRVFLHHSDLLRTTVAYHQRCIHHASIIRKETHVVYPISTGNCSHERTVSRCNGRRVGCNGR